MIKHSYDTAENTFSFTIPENNGPCRIDSYITSQIPDYSRNYFQGIITQGNVTINGIIAKKTSTLVQSADTITVHFPPRRIVEPAVVVDQTVGVSIIAQIDHFMIINKPAHLLVHPPSLTSTAVTLSDWIRHYHNNLSSVGISDRPGIIHRLDRETSGIMIITCTHYAHNAFGLLFRERKINKTYKALVAGHPPKEGTITLAIGRDPINRIKMAPFNEENIDATGKIGCTKVRHAKTDYTVLEYFDDSSLVEVKPTTGRTHQIRVHMAAIGHPVVGDQLYGKKSPLIGRQALHAENLSFTFDEKPYSFNCEIPDDFQQLLNHVRAHSTLTKQI